MKIYDDRQLKLPLRFPPSMATLERKLASARQDLHNLQVMQMKPLFSQRPAAAAAI
jgi:hypothetical protein